MTTLVRKFMAQCMLFSMLAQMFVTTLPAVGAGEEGSLPVLHGNAVSKKVDENQHFNFKEHNGNHYTGDYSYCGKEVPFSADLTSEDGKLILAGLVTLPEPIEPEPFTMTKGNDECGWILKIFDHEFEMRVPLIPFYGENCTITLPQGVYLDMIWVKPGTFMMGSPENELGRWNNEVQHEVTLTKGYWLGKYEVTQAQYVSIMGGENPSRCWGTDQKGPDLPVCNLLRHEVIAFCSTLTAIEKAAGRLPEGYEYNLPTEAQWEYACRAGTTGPYNIDGVDALELDMLAWYEWNSGKKLHPVGQKLPNAWGFYDMHGNASEWCKDYYGSEYYTNSPATDPTGPTDAKWADLPYWVVRGHWGINSHGRSAARRFEGYYSGTKNINMRYPKGSNVGFRLALVPVQ